jgi:potassium-transporting ATPase KdpC subunit
MKKYFLPSLKLTVVLIILCAVLYPLLIAGIATFAPSGGGGEKIMRDGKVVGYANIGQQFTADNYFHGRPSAVDYNAAGSGGSNKAASNPGYIKTVEARIDSFLAHNPAVKKEAIPAEMVTASGSGLDPHISSASAMIQISRIAVARKIAADKIKALVDQHTEKPLLGPSYINVLKLNLALDQLK